MSQPLVVQLAQLSLRRITEAWDLPPSHIHHRPGPCEMAHHFLRDELLLPYRDITDILYSGTFKTAAVRVSAGRRYYSVWPAYRTRYELVLFSFLASLRIVTPLSRSRDVDSVEKRVG